PIHWERVAYRCPRVLFLHGVNRQIIPGVTFREAFRKLPPVPSGYLGGPRYGLNPERTEVVVVGCDRPWYEDQEFRYSYWSTGGHEWLGSRGSPMEIRTPAPAQSTSVSTLWSPLSVAASARTAALPARNRLSCAATTLGSTVALSGSSAGYTAA